MEIEERAVTGRSLITTARIPKSAIDAGKKFDRKNRGNLTRKANREPENTPGKTQSSPASCNLLGYTMPGFARAVHRTLKPAGAGARRYI
jgi:hypothetical protein